MIFISVYYNIRILFSGEDNTDKPASVNSRIEMFNGIKNQSQSNKSDVQPTVTKLAATGLDNKPPELKALLPIHNGGKDSEGVSSYISRSSVEKILLQQRKVGGGTTLNIT